MNILEKSLFFYRVVTTDMKSLGLRRNPHILSYPIQEWFFLPNDRLVIGASDWGGLWVARTLSCARQLTRYMAKKHAIQTRLFSALIDETLYQNSYRVKTNGIFLLEEIPEATSCKEKAVDDQPPFSIVPAGPSHYEIIEEFHRTSQRQCRSEESSSCLGPLFPQAEKDFLKRQAQGCQRHHILLALSSKGYPIGFARALHTLKRQDSKIHKIYVLPKYRRRRIAAAMIETLANRAKERGKTHLTALVPEPSLSLKSFYEKCGFHCPVIQQPRQNHRALWLMEKTL